ncbi:MAG TPA: DegV family protein [Clostridia bacterium]|mgnify:CR=1 FL=1|jgi:DegV family protein with EDD domain
MSFILSADSCCDYFKSDLKKYNIKYIPMAYIIDDVEYRDNFDSDQEYKDFYDKLRSGKMPKTTQLSPFETAEYFEKWLQEEEGDIVHISLSGGLSATAANAKQAAKEVMEKYPGRKIYAIDSKGATQGQRYVLDVARRLRDEGKSAQEVAEHLEEVINRVHHWIFAKDLFHLKRGGRISPAVAMVGTVLGIRPIIVINHKGQLCPFDKERGVAKTLKYAVNALKKYGKKDVNLAYIAHADDYETAELLKNMILEETSVKEVQIGYIGPVIGSHTGPGTVGLVFEADKRIEIDPHD